MLGLLLQVEGANLNIQTLNSQIPAIHFAVAMLNLPLVEKLYNAGALLNIPDSFRLQVMHPVASATATAVNYDGDNDKANLGWRIISWLKDHGAELEPESATERTPADTLY